MLPFMLLSNNINAPASWKPNIPTNNIVFSYLFLVTIKVFDARRTLSATQKTSNFALMRLPSMSMAINVILNGIIPHSFSNRNSYIGVCKYFFLYLQDKIMILIENFLFSHIPFIHSSYLQPTLITHLLLCQNRMEPETLILCLCPRNWNSCFHQGSSRILSSMYFINTIFLQTFEL